jgi:protein associated with RNAse G/E
VSERNVTIRATNYDGSPHWVHPALLLKASEELVVTGTAAGLVIARETGTFTSPFNTRGHYWPDRWFNVIRLDRPDPAGGPPRLDGYYCNIASPVQFDGSTVGYVDLQLDVRAFADDDGKLTHRVLDEDEFEAARRLYEYPADLVERCWQAVDEVVALLLARSFPFDGA